jgi:AraC-like DNA-binding protein
MQNPDNYIQYPKLYFYARLVKAKMFIDHHFAEPIDLNNIADEAYFSKFHFIRMFKTSYGKTPHQYLISLRIEKSKELLAEEIPVADACYAVGFESLASFSRLFKRLTGTTPSSYSVQQQELKASRIRFPLSFIPGCFAEKNGWTGKTAILDK